MDAGLLGSVCACWKGAMQWEPCTPCLHMTECHRMHYTGGCWSLPLCLNKLLDTYVRNPAARGDHPTACVK